MFAKSAIPPPKHRGQASTRAAAEIGTNPITGTVTATVPGPVTGTDPVKATDAGLSTGLEARATWGGRAFRPPA